MADELDDSVVLTRSVDVEHFRAGDIVYAIGTPLEAATGIRFGRYRVTGEYGAHATGERALVLDDERLGVAVRAPARYLIHLER